MSMDSIRKQLGIEPQKGALRTDNGVRNLLVGFVGMDFGRDKSGTVIYESYGKGRFKVRYDLPDDPNIRSYRNWFCEQLRKRLEEFFAKRVKEVEADIFAWIKSNPICYVNPCEAILDGICCVITPAIYPHGNVLAERYDVAEFFLQFPRALPTELKGVAV